MTRKVSSPRKTRPIDKAGTLRRGGPLVLMSGSSAEWLSCSIITPNLYQAYALALGAKNFETFKYGATTDPMGVWRMAREIFLAVPDRIILIDHGPMVYTLLEALALQYGSKPLPPLYFHVYGDFTLYSEQWLKVEKYLLGAKIRWICASKRQADLVSRFIQCDPSDVRVCPFPVDGKKFYFDVEERKKTRKRLGIGSEPVVLYTGRLSMQKNNLVLLRRLMKLREKSKLGFRFLVAGGMDDLGAPFFGVHLQPGSFYQQWTRECERLPDASKSAVTYLGHVESEELRQLYCASDVYASLSLHHDEDFGMAPAEALCCGAPVVLSDWGGYHSMNVSRLEAIGTDISRPESMNNCRPEKEAGSKYSSCQLVPAKITPAGLEISLDHFDRGILRVLQENGTGAEDSKIREERSRAHLSHFSIDAVSEVLKVIHGEGLKKFVGFNDRLRIMERFRKDGVLFPKGPVAQSFYEEIYGVYASPRSN